MDENGIAERNAVSLRFDTTKLCNYEKPTKPLQCFLSGGHRAVNSTGLDEVWYDLVRPEAHADGHVRPRPPTDPEGANAGKWI